MANLRWAGTGNFNRATAASSAIRSGARVSAFPTRERQRVGPIGPLGVA